MLGLDPSTGYVLGGSYNANGGAGALYFWDPSTATAWSTVGNAVLPAITSSYNRGRFWEHGAAPALLYWYYGRYYVGIQPEDIPLVGFDSGSIVGKVFVPQYWGYQYGMPAYRIYDISEEEFNDIWIGRTNSIGRSGSGTFGLNIVKPIYIDGNPWMFFHSQGTLDHYAEQSSPPNTAGIMACHAGIGSVILDVSSLFTEQASPKKIIISQGTDSLDSEFSSHYSKWRFSCRVNSGSWSTPRCGPAELHNLSVEVNGKAGWGPFASTDTVELKAECTSGFLHSFASVQGNPGDRSTPNVKTADIGTPRDVLAIFQYEAISSPETYSFSGSVTLQKQ
jgi:hypothetical protein